MKFVNTTLRRCGTCQGDAEHGVLKPRDAYLAVVTRLEHPFVKWEEKCASEKILDIFDLSVCDRNVVPTE